MSLYDKKCNKCKKKIQVITNPARDKYGIIICDDCYSKPF